MNGRQTVKCLSVTLTGCEKKDYEWGFLWHKRHLYCHPQAHQEKPFTWLLFSEAFWSAFRLLSKFCCTLKVLFSRISLSRENSMQLFSSTFPAWDVQFETCKSGRVSRKVMNVDLMPRTDVKTNGGVTVSGVNFLSYLLLKQ